MSAVAVERTPVVPRPRNPNLCLDAPLPRHWLNGSVVATHIANGVNLLFPAGERFFVRSVHRFKDRAKGELIARVKGFSGQEGRHAREHEKVFRQLEAQGYDLDTFLKLYEKIAYGFIERVTPHELSLAVTAACERFTATLAENVMRSGVMELAHPAMRDLLLWHAAEEIEHRDVAFDLLREVNPSYALRLGGLAMATSFLGGFWALATVLLLLQEKELSRARLLAELANLRERRGLVFGVFARGIREYLRRDFHPGDRDLDQLAADYLARAGL